MVEAAAGKNVWIVGGGELAGQFFDAGLPGAPALNHREAPARGVSAAFTYVIANGPTAWT